MKRRLTTAATSLALIMLVAAATRAGFAWNQISKIASPAVLGNIPFRQETGNIAYAIATGKGFSSPFRRETGPTAWLTPVYPLIVAATFKVFGIFTPRAFYFLLFLNIFFSTATCAPLYYAGKRVAGIGVGSAAAWLWAVFPNAVMIPFEWIWDTCLAALLATVILWATLKLTESVRMRDWCAYGLLWGFALNTNPALGALLPFLLGWAAYRAAYRSSYRAQKRGAPTLSRPAMAAALAVLCCLPWTVRNFIVFNKLVPMRSNFPLELYIGNNENYDDRHPVYPSPITKEREILRYFKIGEVPFMQQEMCKAMDFIDTHPRMDAILTEKRFVAFWVGIASPAYVFRATDSLLIRSLLIANTLAGIGALAGILVLVITRNEFAFPLTVYPVVFPVVYYITHPSVRYRHPIDPVILLLTAVALAATGRKLASWRAARHGPAPAKPSHEPTYIAQQKQSPIFR